MSYPPTPDPFSAPSTRRNPNTPQLSDAGSNAHSDLSSPPFEEDASANSRNYFSSSVDHYTVDPDHTQHADVSGELYARVPSTPEQIRTETQGFENSATGRKSTEVLLTPPTGDNHPLFTPPLLNDGFVPVGTEPRATDRNGSSAQFDPYSRYSSANFSTVTSTADFSDDDSQRVLHRNDGSNGSGGRRGSNLAAYDSAMDYQVKDERSGIIAGGGEKLRKRPAAAGGFWSRQTPRAKKIILLLLVIAIIIIAVVAGTVSSMVRRNAGSRSNVAVDDGGTQPTAPVEPDSGVVPDAPSVPTGNNATINWQTAATGGNGSTVYTADGSSFIYNSTFGGFWNAIPFNNTARAQRDTPMIATPWDYSRNRIYGVNVGGWLLVEPFIVPALFEPYSTGDGGQGTSAAVNDEWSLSVALGANLATTMEQHYRTFITEKDFAEIAAAGLNWVRIPIPFWIIETYPGEPFLANVGWQYFLQALTWARKYGLRVNLDLHAVPGSQNGYNHSSKQGTINFLNGVMGLANAQRTLNYIRTLTQFISQEQYTLLIPMFSIINEPIAGVIGVDNLRRFYLEAYKTVRGITGIGAGRGPVLTIADGFVGYGSDMAVGGWNGFLPGADRLALDVHTYLAFAPPNDDGIMFQASKPCSYWSSQFNTSRAEFGLFVGGEWSLAVNDCGKWINNIGNGARFEGRYIVPGENRPQFPRTGSCDLWDNWESYNATMKAGFRMLAQTHMDSLRDFFFWTWKTGFSPQKGKITNPMWNYQLGLSQNYIPSDPRSALGACAAIVIDQGVPMVDNPVNRPPLAWQTGGAGAGTIDPAQLRQWGQYPVPTMGTSAALIATAFLPTYTNTGSVITMPPAPTPTSFPAGFSTRVSMGNGWAQPSDTTRFATPVATCRYPNAWSGAGAPIPTTRC